MAGRSLDNALASDANTTTQNGAFGHGAQAAEGTVEKPNTSTRAVQIIYQS